VLKKTIVDYVRLFSEKDFWNDLKKDSLLIIHGNATDIILTKVSWNYFAELILHSKYLVYKDATHGLFIMVV
jgi:hypothetical protein